MAESPIEFLSKLDEARRTLGSGPLHERIQQALGHKDLALVDEQRLATVVVSVRGGFQESWSRREELSAELYERLTAIAPHSRRERVPVNFREIDRREPVRTITCSNCRIRPGFGPCPHCSGVGVLLLQRPGNESSYVADCPDCEDGFATCTVCNGSKECIEATVRYVNFKPFDANHIVTETMRDALGQAYPSDTDLPTELAFDVEGTSQSAYRGEHASMARDFHGYAFGDAVKQARAFVRRVEAAPNFVIHELKTFALPYVLATFSREMQSYRTVVYIGAGGVPGCGVV